MILFRPYKKTAGAGECTEDDPDRSGSIKFSW